MGKVLLGSLRIQIQGYILAQNVPFLSDTIYWIEPQPLPNTFGKLQTHDWIQADMVGKSR